MAWILTPLREKINQCDDTISHAFVERMQTAMEIARYKKENGLPVLDPARERTVISHVTEGLDEGMAMNMKLLYNTIFDLSRTYQQRYLTTRTELTNRIQQAIETTPQVFPRSARWLRVRVWRGHTASRLATNCLRCQA